MLIAEAMGRELGRSKPELYGAATLGILIAGVAAYPIGAAIDRGHGRTNMTLGSTLGGALLMAWPQTTSLWVFYLLIRRNRPGPGDDHVDSPGPR